MCVVVIDPGVANLGWSLWDDEEYLSDAGLFIRPRELARRGKLLDSKTLTKVSELAAASVLAGIGGRTVTLCVVERMKVYPREEEKANDLLDVQAIAGLVAGRVAARVEWLWATDWKGSVSKEVSHARAWHALKPGEVTTLRASLRPWAVGLHEHALDSVAIALKHFGRVG